MIEGDDNDRKTDLSRNEEHWRAILLSTAVIGAALLGFISWRYVWQPDNDAAVLQRVRIVTPYAVFFGALVTFLATYWRGLISTRQADQQLQQIRSLSSQIAATERISTVDMFHKGAELLDADANESQHAAGIETMRSIAMGADDQLAVAALNLLVDFAAGQSKRLRTHPNVVSALKAVSDAFVRTGRFSTRRAVVDFGVDDDQWDLWLDFFPVGVERLRIKNGYFKSAILDEGPDYKPCFITFEKCLFAFESRPSAGLAFEQCRFVGCDIFSFDINDIAGCDFRDCDFTLCEFLDPRATYDEVGFPKIQGNANHYDEPPTLSVLRDQHWFKIDDVVWESVFLKE